MTAPTTRFVGVDLARGLAVLGMFVAHLGWERSTEFLSGTGWFWITDGRSSALFATLAGVGVAFMTRRAVAETDPDRAAIPYRVQRIRLLKRSAVLMVLGWMLVLLGTPVAVILGSYAVLFAMVIPVLRWRPVRLLGLAAAVAVLMPALLILSREALIGGATPHSYPSQALWVTAIPIVAELWSGYYPAVVWVAYILVGLAVARMGLGALRTQLGLVAAGAALACVGYGAGIALSETVPASAGSLVTIDPHSNTTTEVIGNTGVALAVLGLSLLLTRPAAVRLALTPVSAIGAMSLTVYSSHIVYIWVLGNDAVWNPRSNWPLIGLVLVSAAFATIWQLVLGRGPLERLVQRLIRTEPPLATLVPPGPGSPGAPAAPGWGPPGGDARISTSTPAHPSPPRPPSPPPS